MLNMPFTINIFNLRFEDGVYEKWSSQVDQKSEFNLNQALINRNEESMLVSINFDPQVSYCIIAKIINVLNACIIC